MNKFLIPAQNLGELNFRLEKLNKKTKKLGLEPIVSKVLGVVFHKDERYFELEVTGAAPKLPGWTFVGTLQHTPAGNVTRNVPGQEIPATYHNSPRTCDHCQKIRNRKDTYVVRHDDGTYKQVGHNCVRDFLGHVDPKALAMMAETIKTFEEAGGEGFSGSGRMADITEDFLAMTAAVVAKFGFVSRASAMKYAETSGFTKELATTVAQVWRYLHPTKDMIKDRDILVPTADHSKTAQDALDWISRHEPRNEYERNLKLVASLPTVEARNGGLLASLVSFHQKQIGIEAERFNKFKELQKSEYVGELKKREIFVLRVDAVRGFSNEYGDLAVYRMRDMNGNVFVWFSRPGLMEENKTYEVKATVKKHDEWKGIKQTILTRGAVQKIVDSPSIV